MNEGEDGEQGRDRRLERETVEDGRTEKKEEICRDRVIDKSDSSKSEREGGNDRREGWESVKGRDESAGKRGRVNGEEESEGVKINVNECRLDERERERDGKEGRKRGRIGKREGKRERRRGIDKKDGELSDNGDGSMVDKGKKQRDDVELKDNKGKKNKNINCNSKGNKGGMKVIFWNVAGIENKDEDFWEFIQEFDIVNLTETWLEEKRWKKFSNRLPGGWRWKHQAARRESRKGRAMGGIITGVKVEVKERATDRIEKEGIQEREVVHGNEIWRIVTVYNRVNGGQVLLDLDEGGKGEEEENLLIGGDFNARIGERGSGGRVSEVGMEEERKSKDKVVNKEGKQLLELIEDRGWIILNGNKEGDEEGEWTFEGKGQRVANSVIDLGVVNWAAWEKVDRFEVGVRIESDHQPVMVRIGEVRETEGGTKAEESEIKYQDWSEEGENEYRKRLERVEWNSKGVEEGWEELEEVVRKATQYKVMKKSKKVGWKPWWDRECRESKRAAQKAKRKFKKAEGEEIERKRREFYRKRKEYRDLCNRKKLVLKEREEKELEKISTECQPWKYINKYRSKKEGVSEKISIEEWVKHFREVLGGREERIGDTDSVKENKETWGNEEGLEEGDIGREIKRLKKRKAAGPDGIKNEAWLLGGQMIRCKLAEIIKEV